jgi:hypothetical protein
MNHGGSGEEFELALFWRNAADAADLRRPGVTPVKRPVGTTDSVKDY